MTSPEIKVETPPQVEHIPEQFKETPVEQAEGIQAVQVHPPTPPVVQTQSGQQIVAVPAPPSGPSITLPSDPAVLSSQSHGSASDSTTWNAWFWLRLMKKAIAKQIAVLIKGGGTPQNGTGA